MKWMKAFLLDTTARITLMGNKPTAPQPNTLPEQVTNKRYANQSWFSVNISKKSKSKTTKDK